MTWNLVTFADEKFKPKQDFLSSYATSLGLKVHSYSYDWLTKEKFFTEHSDLFENSIGQGFFSWKPYILLDAMKNLEDGDIVFYCDTNDIFDSQLIPYVEELIDGEFSLLLMGGSKNKDWTRRDCFVFMECDEEDYWDCTQLEAGMCFWKVCDESKEILSEWLKYCSDRRIISDDPNVGGKDNFPTFKEHRRDQSVLTNLAVKHGLCVVGSEIREFVECNCDYWYERNNQNGYILGRIVDKLLVDIRDEYPHA